MKRINLIRFEELSDQYEYFFKLRDQNEPQVKLT